MADQIDITGLDKADVLAALYNASHPQGMGYLHFDPAPMTPAQARAILTERGDDLSAMFGRDEINQTRGPGRKIYFDYLKGRVMKVNLSGDSFDPWGFDRDNGPGAAEAAIAPLRIARAA